MELHGMSAACRRAGIFLIGSSLALAGPAFLRAGAAGAGPLNRLTGTTVTGSEGSLIFDASCPLNDDPGVFNGPEPHEQWQAVIGGSGPTETLTMTTCEEESGALGGESFPSGSFQVSSREGTVKGTIVGHEAFRQNDAFFFTLTITGGTRGLAHTSGVLSLSGCETSGSFIAGNLATGPQSSPTLPQVCG